MRSTTAPSPRPAPPTRARRGPSSTSERSRVARAEIADLLRELNFVPLSDERRSRVRERLVELNGHLVRYVARRFASSTEPMDDLVQVGMIGLLKAMNRFDPDRGLEFATYAIPTIDGEIKRYFRDATWAVHVPRRLRELQSGIVAKQAELSQEFGRVPTPVEIAERLDAPPSEVREALYAAGNYSAASLDEGFDGDGGGIDPGYHDERLGQVDRYADLRPAIRRLSQRQRKILALRFVFDRTQTEIARTVGVSQMHVSRLLASSLQELREALTTPERGAA